MGPDDRLKEEAFAILEDPERFRSDEMPAMGRPTRFDPDPRVFAGRGIPGMGKGEEIARVAGRFLLGLFGAEDLVDSPFAPPQFVETGSGVHAINPVTGYAQTVLREPTAPVKPTYQKITGAGGEEQIVELAPGRKPGVVYKGESPELDTPVWDNKEGHTIVVGTKKDYIDLRRKEPGRYSTTPPDLSKLVGSTFVDTSVPRDPDAKVDVRPTVSIASVEQAQQMIRRMDIEPGRWQNAKSVKSGGQTINFNAEKDFKEIREVQYNTAKSTMMLGNNLKLLWASPPGAVGEQGAIASGTAGFAGAVANWFGLDGEGVADEVAGWLAGGNISAETLEKMRRHGYSTAAASQKSILGTEEGRLSDTERDRMDDAVGMAATFKTVQQAIGSNLTLFELEIVHSELYRHFHGLPAQFPVGSEDEAFDTFNQILERMGYEEGTPPEVKAQMEAAAGTIVKRLRQEANLMRGSAFGAVPQRKRK